MMNRLPSFISSFLILFSTLVLSQAYARLPLEIEIVEVPLPELHGLYTVDSVYTRTAHFQLDRAPLEVFNVWIRLAGIANTGLIRCEGPYGQDIFGPWWTYYKAFMQDLTTGMMWEAFYIYEDSSSALDFTMKFRTDSQAAWDFLKQGTGDLTLMWNPLGLILLCWEIFPPSVEITEAILIIEGDFPVPVEPTTWGAIKSLFLIEK